VSEGFVVVDWQDDDEPERPSEAADDGP
jgi:hypothetical protein